MDYLTTGAVHIGDVRELAGRLEPGSVQTIVTSPPYWGLRDYGTATWEGGDGSACEHVDRAASNAKNRLAGAHSGDIRNPTPAPQTSGERATVQYRGTCARCGATRVDKQLGIEATPAEFVVNLVAVFRALRPALKEDATCWLILGDAYGPGKQLLMLPHRVALALQADGWIVRMDCVWAKPAPMPESVTDRPTRSHEYLFLLTKQPRYFYDATAIAETAATSLDGRASLGVRPLTPGQEAIQANGIHGKSTSLSVYDRPTRNKRSVWEIPSAQFPGAHFATFPPDLVRPCVLAGTSARGECGACGVAWRRVVERGESSWAIRKAAGDPMRYGDDGNGQHQGRRSLPDAAHRSAGGLGVPATATTTGWAPQCQCPPGTPTRPQVVLDPFAGSCTTWQVAHELGRDFVGIDLDERAVKWAAHRLAKYPVGLLPGLVAAAGARG